MASDIQAHLDFFHNVAAVFCRFIVNLLDKRKNCHYIFLNS